MKHRVPEFAVAGPGNLRQAFHKDLRLPGHDLRNQLIPKIREKLWVTGEVTAIEQRKDRLWIVRVKRIEFGEGPYRCVQLQPKIAHSL